jgi:hypothetical protein
MRAGLVFLSLVVCQLVASVGAASVFDELHGVRSLGMGGAHRGLGTSNDTLYLNPAGMAVGRRYAVELNYGYSPFDELTSFNTSAVDSKSGPVAGGLGYTLERGDAKGADATLHRIYMGAAYPISDAFAFGMTAKNIRGTFVDNGEKKEVALYTGDVGIITRLGQGIGFGLTAHNIVKTDINRMTPLTFGAGLTWDSAPLTVAADFEVDARQKENRLQTWRAGAEYFLGSSFPIRAGWHLSPFTKKDGAQSKEHVLSFGGGWVNPGGMLALGAERSLARANNWRLVATLGFYL